LKRNNLFSKENGQFETFNIQFQFHQIDSNIYCAILITGDTRNIKQLLNRITSWNKLFKKSEEAELRLQW